MYCVDLAPVQFVGKGGISYVCTGDLPLGVRGGFVCIARVKSMYSTYTHLGTFFSLRFSYHYLCTEASRGLVGPRLFLILGTYLTYLDVVTFGIKYVYYSGIVLFLFAEFVI